MSEVYIQSFNEYAHEFHTKSGKVIIPPLGARPKNIAILSQEQYDELMAGEGFKVHMNAKVGQFRKLDSMPRSAVDVQEKIAEAEAEANRARIDADKARREADAVKRELEKTKKELEEAGGVIAPESAKIARAQAEIEQANKERDDALAELSKLKEARKPGRPAKDSE